MNKEWMKATLLKFVIFHSPSLFSLNHFQFSILNSLPVN